MASPIRLLLSDVDGTLVNPAKELTPRTLHAVKQLRAAGVEFAITSARPPAGIGYLGPPLGLTTPIAGFNGGMVVAGDGTVLSQHLLAAPSAQYVIQVLEEYGIDIWVFHGNDWLLTNPNGDNVDRELATIRYPGILVPDFTAVLGRVNKIVGSSNRHDRLLAAQDVLRGKLGNTASIAMSQSYYLDITDALANKGSSVRALSEALNIPTEEIATIGDMENDVAMFEVSGYSIAMGNASPEVQAQATSVTLPNTEDGFAAAVERFILPLAVSRNGPQLTE